MAAEPVISFERLDDLGASGTHDLLKLRFDVFVLEQQSLYPEIDGQDPEAIHAIAREGAEMIGTVRLIGVKDNAPLSFGRVAVRADYRGTGLGRKLVTAALEYLSVHAAGRVLTIGAQKHLKSWYGGFGFETSSGEYDDGGIPHVDMRLTLPHA